jgi:hypothetical protein
MGFLAPLWIAGGRHPFSCPSPLDEVGQSHCNGPVLSPRLARKKHFEPSNQCSGVPSLRSEVVVQVKSRQINPKFVAEGSKEVKGVIAVNTEAAEKRHIQVKLLTLDSALPSNKFDNPQLGFRMHCRFITQPYSSAHLPRPSESPEHSPLRLLVHSFIRPVSNVSQCPCIPRRPTGTIRR